MANPTKLRPWQLRPTDDALSEATHQFFDWVQTTLNTLIGQQVPSALGLSALSPSTVDPKSSIVVSGGSRTSSIVTAMKFIAAATSITFYFDGTNTSSPLTIYRDDGSIVTPIVGNLAVIGLSPSTKYFFYPYFDEILGKVVFASVVGAVGSPPVAYTAVTLLAAQQQILRSHIPLASQLATTGVTTPAAGTNAAANAGGSGGSVGARLGENLT